MLEEQVDGIDIRAYVIGSRVAAAATRIHAHVVGDGGRSITELVAEKQAWRAQHANMRKSPIVVDLAMLARQGRSVDDTPAADEVVVVNGMANVGLGGESVDVTELTHPDLMTMAVDAAPGHPWSGCGRCRPSDAGHHVCRRSRGPGGQRPGQRGLVAHDREAHLQPGYAPDRCDATGPRWRQVRRPRRRRRRRRNRRADRRFNEMLRRSRSGISSCSRSRTTSNGPSRRAPPSCGPATTIW